MLLFTCPLLTHFGLAAENNVTCIYVHNLVGRIDFKRKYVRKYFIFGLTNSTPFFRLRNCTTFCKDQAIWDGKIMLLSNNRIDNTIFQATSVSIQQNMCLYNKTCVYTKDLDSLESIKGIGGFNSSIFGGFCPTDLNNRDRSFFRTHINYINKVKLPY